MSSNKYCLDTNIIITLLFEIEPNNKIVTGFVNKYPKSYYTEHVRYEIEKVIHKKIELISKILYDSIISINNSDKEIMNYNSFISLTLSDNKRYLYRKKEVSTEVKKKILTSFWNNNNYYNVHVTSLRKSILDYVNNIKISTITYKEEVLENMCLIRKHEKYHENIISTSIKNNIHKEDSLIILDIYEFYLNKQNKIIFISLDKELTYSLLNCNFNFLEEIWGLSELKIAIWDNET